MPQYIDMMGHILSLNQPAKRIVSVVPSQTELLYSLGLEQEVIGITKFCIHPNTWFRTKERIGGTKNLNIEKILALAPDVVIANKEENEQNDILQLQQHVPVWLSDIVTIEDAYTMMEGIGVLTDKQVEAQSIIASLQTNFQNTPAVFHDKKVGYLIWRNPWMAAGSGTFIHAVLTHLGAHNAFGKSNRYPELSVAQLQASDIDILLLSSEPYPFKEQHLLELQTILPHTQIALVDGEVFSWYGSRLLHLKDYIKLLGSTL